MFQGLNNIDEISLRWNPIETIAGFAFAGIRNVSQIYLGYNKYSILTSSNISHNSLLLKDQNSVRLRLRWL